MNDRPLSLDPLARAGELLAADRPQQALEVITRSRIESSEARNAKAVCLLRMGQVPQATAILSELVFPRGSISPSPDAPVIFYTNYVTAMMMQGKVVAAMGVLDQVPDAKHPAVLRVRESLRRWRRGLGVGWRVLGIIGLYPERPVDLGSPPGDIA